MEAGPVATPASRMMGGEYGNVGEAALLIYKSEVIEWGDKAVQRDLQSERVDTDD